MVPFAEVLVHTYIDNLREEEGRTVNHHGKAVDMHNKDTPAFIKVQPTNPAPVATTGKAKRGSSSISPRDLVSRNEFVEVMARQASFFKKIGKSPKTAK